MHAKEVMCQSHHHIPRPRPKVQEHEWQTEDMQGTDGTEVAHGQDETRPDMHVRIAAVVQKMTKKARKNVDKISSTFSSLKNAVLLRV